MAFITDRTGPQVHAAQVAKQLFHTLGAQAPPLRFDQETPSNPGYMNATPKAIFPVDNPNIGSVNLTPSAVKDVDFRHPNALLALVHELAHTRQSKETFGRGSPVFEGGADAFARKVAPGAILKSGLRPAGPVSGRWGARPYDSFVQMVLDTLGRQWVDRGQFGG